MRRKKSRFWPFLRVCFRRFRVMVWLLLLGLVVSVIYLNHRGLPDFIKRPLLQKLQARGIDLEFSRLRLRWYEGLVAQDVQFGQAVRNSPRLTAREAKVLLNWRSLLRGNVQVDSLMVRGGRLAWPIVDSANPSRELVLDNIQTELRLLPDDQWLLDQFQADFARAEIHVTASITNASAARDWPFLRGRKTPETGRLQQRMRAFADVVDRIEFAERPGFDLDVRGDARDLQGFNVRLAIQTPRAQTPWGNVTNGVFRIRTLPAAPDGEMRAEVELDAISASTRWGTADHFSLAMELSSLNGVTNRIDGSLRLNASSASTPWASGRDVSATGAWQQHMTNPVPVWAEAKVSFNEARTRWGTAAVARVQGRLTTTNQTRILPQPEWAWWTNLHPFALEWDAQLQNVKMPKIEVSSAKLAGVWNSPILTLHSVNAKLYGGNVSLTAALDVDSRQAEASAVLNLDLHKVDDLLTEGGRRWLSHYTWGGAPTASVDAKAILPAWTNRRPNWREEVLPTLWLSGQFNLAHGAGYNGIDALSARSHFVYSNMNWHLPDLVVTRPEGELRAEHRANDRTHQYSWKIHSTVDPNIIRPLLSTNETRGLDLLELSSPPDIEAELWGTFHKPELLGARAHVSVTNFSFRAQHATTLRAEFAYTNKVLQVFNPHVERGDEVLGADGVTADFNREQVYLTNAWGTADPLAVARAIGPKVGRNIEPYAFDRPIKGRVYGTIPMHGEMGADLHFDVDGGPFHWWKFNVPHISGHVHWKDEELTLSELKSDFYHGTAEGKAVFDVSDAPGTPFWFWVKGTNVLLQALLADLSTSTNRSEGRLDGVVVVTSANSSDWRSVQGYGQFDLHNGLLWDIPLFGVLSPVLDGIMPGLGNSRATAGTCSYVITNGVVRTEDLDIRTPTMRLQYRGDVDLAEDYRLDARVEAELLKDMWVVGPLVSTVLWPVTKLFEYKVTGTLSEPHLVPSNFVPKLMLLPFHPLRLLKGLGTSGSPNPSIPGDSPASKN